MPIPPLVQKSRKLLEAQVTKAIVKFMKRNGWRPIRHQRTVVPGAFQTAEPGMADYQFLLYLPEMPGLSLCVWVEMKGQTDRRKCSCLQRAALGKRGVCGVCRQANWRKREEALGALFGPGHDPVEFEKWYDSQFHDFSARMQKQMAFDLRGKK